MDGASIITKSLAAQGVEFIFGVVGVPIIEVAMAAQAEGIAYIGMRNEQAAGYAAQAMGFLSGRPGLALVVSGPGQLHALGCLANAALNGWPMLLIAGASDQDQELRGAFQEWPQVESARLYTKLSARPPSLAAIPRFVHEAFRAALYGQPGPVYLDIPGNFVNATAEEDSIEWSPRVERLAGLVAEPSGVAKASALIKAAERPLLIIGKGCYGGDVEVLRVAVGGLGLPFLATPMGKGIIPDSSPLSVASARSTALLRADLIVLAGAPLNWMLHFGAPPRFAADARFVQISTEPAEAHANRRAEVFLQAEPALALSSIAAVCARDKWRMPHQTPWWTELRAKVDDNKRVVEAMAADSSLPLNYYAAYEPIRRLTPRDAIVVNEGANTMDIGRTMLGSEEPKRRLDAGTFGTMGVGLGYAIAAALWARKHSPRTSVVCVQGDSAFGFAGMELETAVRHHLPIVLIVLNNNGIYQGLDAETWAELGDPSLSAPPTSLNPDTRYDAMATALGARGVLCRTAGEVERAYAEALRHRDGPTLINVLIKPTSERKPQQFQWLTRSQL